MSGSLVIVGLGPGSIDLLTPAAARALQAATDLVGYETYLDRIPESIFSRRRHASGNRVEIDRVRHALNLAVQGNKVAVVSGGDPGVFAMAAAVLRPMGSVRTRLRAAAGTCLRTATACSELVTVQMRSAGISGRRRATVC